MISRLTFQNIAHRRATPLGYLTANYSLRNKKIIM
jgi:hypothetical protein